MAVLLMPEIGQITTGEGPVQAAAIRLGPFPRGAVLVLSDAGGLTESAGTMNELAQHGYETLAADLSEVSDDLAAVESLLGRLAEYGWDHEQIGIVGFGSGGWTALGVAARFALGAAVSVAVPVRSGHTAERVLASLQTPWLGLIGGRHPARARLAAIARTQARVHAELLHYPGTQERFYTSGSDVLGHAAAFDSRQRTVEWLNLRVVPRLTPRSLSWRARRCTTAGTP
ncbi:dienelactone hydrolase family protein [Nocardia vinacea]|uniref:Dienelactone hydrolase family protein n=1 Tax=Nocardia vinacea TaxID=96468 RepID=A0ABZ1YTN0_9NOCA|nr:dienelactone hydrolase family protein [Nocardia vinacea]